MTNEDDSHNRSALQSIAAFLRAGQVGQTGPATPASLPQDLLREQRLPAILWRGYLASKRGDTIAARDYFEAARQIDRRNPQLLAQLGALHDQLGDSIKAEYCYRESLRHEPRNAIVHYNLGVVLQRKRDLPRARRAYETAVLHEPRLHPAWLNLGNVFRDLKEDARAKECYRRAIDLEPRFAIAHHALGVLAQAHQQHAAAIAHFRAALQADVYHLESWLDLVESLERMGDCGGVLAAIGDALRLHPANATLQFKRQALTGEQVPSMPDAMVEKIFNTMANEFDDHLVGRLGYRIPRQLTALLSDWLGNRRPVSVLDLGCGTGLFGVEMAAVKSRLVGVDLSARMVEQAHARGTYDRLHVSSIGKYLETFTDEFDLVAATDVLIYVGALETMFAGVRARMGPGGRFAFSTESPAVLKDGFCFTSAGRYAHSPAYIRALAEATGFEVVAQEPAVIRTEANVPIEGFVFVLECRD